jgi:hypothetical protein
MSNDIVAELDAWLRDWGKYEDVRPLVRRARDEIVALRADLAATEGRIYKAEDMRDACTNNYNQGRNVGRTDALEEAAKAIRALKEKKP